jgi:hypothetical protein
VSAFPWDNLIIATATLGAALGSAALKSHLDRKDRAAQATRDDASARADRQSAAYRTLVATATEVVHNYRQRQEQRDTHEASAEQEVYLRGRGETVSGELFRAVADVQLAGSEDARKSAAELGRAAVQVGDALEYGNEDESRGALEDFEAAIGAFIDAVRA